MAVNKTNMADSGRGGRPAGPGMFSKPQARRKREPQAKTLPAGNDRAALNTAWREANAGNMRDTERKPASGPKTQKKRF